MRVKKGILLAGGNATRLFPLTLSTSKHLLPIWNKPMIYYPLSNFLKAGINKILLISSKKYISFYKQLLGNGRLYGINITYKIQNKPLGIPQAFSIGKEFINNDPIALNLGDHIFFGNDIDKKIKSNIKNFNKTTIFTYKHQDFSKYGVIEYSKNKKPLKIYEKPNISTSKEIVCGFYIFDKKVDNYIKNLKKSKRGEYEISDLINLYINNRTIKIEKIDYKSNYWIDAGTPEKIYEASQIIKKIEKNKKKSIGSIEIAAFNSGLISYSKLKHLCSLYNNKPYGNYLNNFTKKLKNNKYEK
mgnify:CR=1 FL=1